MRAAVLALVVLPVLPALAQHHAYEPPAPRSRDIATWGVGEERCGEVLREPRSQAEVAPWVDGYLTGVRHRAHRQNAAYLTSRVLDFCRSHPTVTIAEAIRRVR